jgi:2-oxoglutarate dehydrogenase E2 component (dihydrolipoamide succinyltransferase)
MLADVKVPDPGESVAEGTIGRWLKREGDIVREGDVVCELETAKITMEVPAPASGRLQIIAPEGATVPKGAVIAKIDTSVTVPANGAGAKAPTEGPKKEAVAPVHATVPPSGPIVMPAGGNLASQLGIDPTQLSGTGRGGRILKEDVQAAATKPTTNGGPPVPVPPPSNAGAERETRKRMTPLRANIGIRLLTSQKTTASLTTFNEADMSAVMDLRTKYKETFNKKHGINLGFMSFFVKAAVEALKAYPLVNARIDGADIVYHNFYNVGVAVSTEKGLMVPILRDADRMSFAGVEKSIVGMAARAREGKITLTDLEGGTFTITNGGVFGSMMSTPILNPPQSAILGLHAINKRAVVVNDQIVIRPMMYLALTYDHRLIDGREAVLFLVRIKECIESPERLMLEI